MTSVFRMGFPIAYMVMGDPDNETQRQQVVAEFLMSVKEHLPSLNPLFFFSDKEKGQLNAIRTVFKMTPSLCYWHMKTP